MKKIVLLSAVHLALGTPSACKTQHQSTRSATLALAAMEAEFKKFVELHRPPAHIAEQIELHKKEIKAKQFGQINTLPNLFFKGGDIRRIINADHVRDYIAAFGLECLDVTQKYLYEIDGCYLVVAEFVPGTPLR